MEIPVDDIFGTQTNRYTDKHERCDIEKGRGIKYFLKNKKCAGNKKNCQTTDYNYWYKNNEWMFSFYQL